jgi:hypothetical protein
MEDSGIENLASSYGRTVSHSRIVASNADQPSHPEELTLRSSVPMPVSPLLVGQRDWTFRRGHVSSVAQSTAATSTLQARPAPVHVVSSSLIRGEGSEEAVYNLEVEGAHEYFAQGILVHNCRYILYSTFGHGRSAQPWLDHMFGQRDPS